MEWSDGSKSMFIGNQAFELNLIDVTKEYTYVYTKQVCANMHILSNLRTRAHTHTHTHTLTHTHTHTHKRTHAHTHYNYFCWRSLFLTALIIYHVKLLI